MTTTINVPVLIVGAGGAGLTASMLLSELGVETYTINNRPTTSRLPKAHILHQRVMEVYRRLGLEQDIKALSTPPENMAQTAWYAGLGGDHPNAGRQIVKMQAWGDGGKDPEWAIASPCIQENLPQLHLEPLLRDHAEAKAPGSIHFSHELIDLVQDADGVTARIKDLTKNEEYEVRAQYVLGCDGGKTVGRFVGIETVGPAPQLYAVTVHMSADLSDIAQDDDVLLRWFWPPNAPGIQVIMAPMGPTKWGPASEEWVCHMAWPAEELRIKDDDVFMAHLRDVLGLGDRDIEVHMITRWNFEAVVANTYRSGRVFVAGDAAHRHGPTGGLGLNSAVQDVENLTWKLVEVMKGNAGDELLDTYEMERKPVAERNVRRTTENGLHHLKIAEALGIHPMQSPEEAWEQMNRFWSGKPEDAEYRKRVRAAIAAQSSEFNEHAVEFGYPYEQGAIISDGTPVPESVDDIRVYVPSTRPGTHVPHAFLKNDDGQTVSIVDLSQIGQFLLLGGEDAQPWIDAAHQAAETTGIRVNAVTIGHAEGDLFDERLAWLRRREISREGAVLVRPDGVVAWRSMGASDNPTETLEAAIRQILFTYTGSTSTTPATSHTTAK